MFAEMAIFRFANPQAPVESLSTRVFAPIEEQWLIWLIARLVTDGQFAHPTDDQVVVAALVN